MSTKKSASAITTLPLFSREILDDGSASLRSLREQCVACQACELSKTRTNTVFGTGNASHPVIAFVGEAPGEQEDLQGEPFVGKSGHLLTQMIEAMRLDRSALYILNVVACRPPGNRVPTEIEIKSCSKFMLGQLRAVRPEIIITLGATASRALVKGGRPMSEMRGQWHSWEGTPVRVTYHPAYLLRNPEAKGDCWKDLLAVTKRIGFPETNNQETKVDENEGADPGTNRSGLDH